MPEAAHILASACSKSARQPKSSTVSKSKTAKFQGDAMPEAGHILAIAWSKSARQPKSTTASKSKTAKFHKARRKHEARREFQKEGRGISCAARKNPGYFLAP
jgi:hypothetical protein